MAESSRLIIAATTVALIGALGGCTPEHTTPTQAAADNVEQPGDPADFRHWSRGDARVDEWDFAKAVEVLGLHEAWDTDGDGLVSGREFEAVIFQIWDDDDSGAVEREEWKQTAPNWYRSQQPFGEFAEWDRDGDGQIDRAELSEGLAATDAFRYWDANDDGMLTQAEFAEEAFAVWDTSNNGMIDRQEWERTAPKWNQEFAPPRGVTRLEGAER